MEKPEKTNLDKIKIKNLMEKIDARCKRCGAYNSRIMIPERDEEVCGNCGRVYGESILEDTYEKRNFSAENSGGKPNESRISGPTRDGFSLGTITIVSNKGGGSRVKKNSGGVEKTIVEKGFSKN